jgi:hypothetical protein
VNPSFETGDFTGWLPQISPETSGPNMRVVGGDATDGGYYASADVKWYNTHDALYTRCWAWGCGYSQELTIPSGTVSMTVDVRSIGFDEQSNSSWDIVLLASDADRSFSANVDSQSLAYTLLPNGFRRYTVDISGASDFDSIGLSIGAGGQSYDEACPVGPTEFSVDNFQFVPEPASLSLLILGSLAIWRQRRIRSHS